VLVALTQAGHALVDRVVDQVLGREAQLVRGLVPAERAELAALLDRLLQDVVGQTGDAKPARRAEQRHPPR
jgi:DNA-binding MarR family transcriptional regulator